MGNERPVKEVAAREGAEARGNAVRIQLAYAAQPLPAVVPPPLHDA